MDLIEIDRRIMSDTVVEKTWKIPAHADQGPVTITLRMPQVRVTDSEGRHFVISPAQADLVSARMSDIIDWIDEASASETEEGGD
jgi:hypothetical protein